MKNLFTLILILLSTHLFSQEVSVLYLNSAWNSRNAYQDIDKLKGVKILKADYDQQPPSIRQAVRSVPAIVVFKNGRPVATWQADISMKLNVKVEDVQAVIDNAKAPTRRASTN